ncbi:hypothetical protein VTN00DRAFT_4554 [Thermoascus crustaceus]|uniref:uncharacterized protein n=1 Tax=Thermoascus crustaceus TaxID=5088 RepID=UPI003743E5A0
MARLNDLPAPTESIEALKRRFVRQNREIARVNSIQSLRIQSLESEVARLLSENVSLHERVIALSQEVTRYESARMLNDGVYDLKGKLDAKLAELGNLVIELGMLPRKVARVYDSRSNSIGPGQEKSSSFNHRPVAVEPEDGVDFDDGRLPVILEDKYYPRKTLEPRESQDLTDATSDIPDSPEIGPPPIAHLDVEESLGPDLLSEPFELEKPVETDIEPNDAPTPPNLETRKKRKGRSLASDTRPTEMTIEHFSSANEPKNILKQGSKRKFSHKDEDDEFQSSRNGIDDDFRFIRRVHESKELLEHVPTSEDSPSNIRQADLKREFKNQAPPRRKVLEPKSTNINPVSPRKHVATENENSKIPLEDGHKDTLSDAGTKSPPYNDSKHNAKVTQNKQKQREKADESSENRAVDTIPASVSKGESTLSAESKDTSLPQSHDASESNTLAVASRPTRRPRGAVSYAEPNLRDKMRRPTDEFVDAVGGDRFRRVPSSRPERTEPRDESQATHTGKTKMKAGTLKAGENTEPTSRTIPATDSTDKATTSLGKDAFNGFSELPISVITERKRRTLSANKDDLLQPQVSDGPAFEDTSSTFMLGGRRSSNRKRREGNQDPSLDGGPEKRDSSAGHASQNETDSHPLLVRSSASLNKDVLATRQSRRHSSNPSGTQRELSPRWSAGSLPQSHRFQTSHMSRKQAERIDEISKDSLKPMNDLNQIDGHGDIVDEEGKSSNLGSKMPNGITDIPDMTAMDAGQLKRGQRAAARRRSMML